MSSITLQIESVLIDITDKIISFLPDDMFVKILLVLMTFVIVFGISRLFAKDEAEDTI